MAFADSTTYFKIGDASIVGCFNLRAGSYHGVFEYSTNPAAEGFSEDYPHYVWVGPSLVAGTEKRYARVLKTVAYVIVDEDENGPVIEKWQIKGRNIYPRPEGV